MRADSTIIPCNGSNTFVAFTANIVRIDQKNGKRIDHIANESASD